MLNYDNKGLRSLAKALAEEENTGCTCGIKTGKYKLDPDCPIHAEDVNRKVIVEIEAPASYGVMERIYPNG